MAMAREMPIVAAVMRIFRVIAILLAGASS
jgi:hypothetical protein